MRIAIVNDLAMAVEAIRRVILSGDHLLAWTAADGQQAVELCRGDVPDLILMDLFMPGVDGAEATRRIMGQSPCAILVVTANVTDSCAKAFEAMGAGALDAVNTPVLEWPGCCKGAAELLAKIETIRKLIGAPPSRKAPARPSGDSEQPGPPVNRLIAIGASAGGPAALATILSYLPANFHTPIAIVQHVDSRFASSLANWLDDQTPLRVRLAQEGDRPMPGTILLAGLDRHLVFANSGRLAYISEPVDCLYRPSVDVFFNSVVRHWQGEVIGVLLTGMGRDGAQGLLRLRQHGHYTIAQDPAGCAVYGMPKAAAELSAASGILNLHRIGLRLRSFSSRTINHYA